MGESAGANLSAVMCLLARDRGGPALSHQGLLYPATDMSTPPTAATAKALIIPQPEMLAYRRHYLADADPRDPRVSPLLAEDHSRLPPALIQVGEHDPLRDDGARYAAALRACRCGSPSTSACRTATSTSRESAGAHRRPWENYARSRPPRSSSPWRPGSTAGEPEQPSTSKDGAACGASGVTGPAFQAGV